jgi:hypothetical protein
VTSSFRMRAGRLIEAAGLTYRRRAPAKSSLSDTERYRALCRRAAQDDLVFSEFRRHPDYTWVLEHVTEELGWRYLEAFQHDQAVLDHIRGSAGATARGGPEVFDFGFSAPVSPTLLRYGKVAADLRQLFGPLDGSSIVEVGVGYGGQHQVICGISRIMTYVMIDLPEVLELAAKWISAYPSSEALRLVNGLAPSRMSLQPADLFISNYAFSEIERPLQELILADWVASSARGYVTYNHIGGSRDIMTAEEFARRVPGADIIDEVPQTNPRNCIVVWGHH